MRPASFGFGVGVLQHCVCHPVHVLEPVLDLVLDSALFLSWNLCWGLCWSLCWGLCWSQCHFCAGTCAAWRSDEGQSGLSGLQHSRACGGRCVGTGLMPAGGGWCLPEGHSFNLDELRHVCLHRASGQCEGCSLDVASHGNCPYACLREYAGPTRALVIGSLEKRNSNGGLWVPETLSERRRGGCISGGSGLSEQGWHLKAQGVSGICRKQKHTSESRHSRPQFEKLRCSHCCTDRNEGAMCPGSSLQQWWALLCLACHTPSL